MAHRPGDRQAVGGIEVAVKNSALEELVRYRSQDNPTNEGWLQNPADLPVVDGNQQV